ncbi:MAG: ABC transporter, partial [Defluviitaleaceae bacterium]|nr:ABC transporter [Defluviitaleaceae bacterium]
SRDKLVITTFSGEVLSFELENTLAAQPILEKYKDQTAGFQVVQGSMDDAFIGITGKGLRQ